MKKFAAYKIDVEVLSEFNKHCLLNSLKKSGIIETLMKRYLEHEMEERPDGNSH
jgi:hypothetical protein